MLHTFLALGLALLLRGLRFRKGESRPPHVAAFELGAAYLFFAHAFSWIADRAALAPAELPAPLAWREAVVQAMVCQLLGALAYRAGPELDPAITRGRDRVQLGGSAGLLVALLGYWAHCWLSVAQSWRLLGYWAGGALFVALPWLLAAGLALTTLVLAHRDFRPSAGSLLLALLISWGGGAEFSLWRLRAAWSLGPRTLVQAAGLPPTSQSAPVSVVWLKPSGGLPPVPETKAMIAEGLEGSGESLERVKLYLLSRAMRTVFKEQAISALRKGWRQWWDADLALEADMLHEAGIVAPDYRAALGLIRSGPLTSERYAKLLELSRLGAPRKEGFEGVTQAQYIFEGFSAAFARFGKEEEARAWLLKIDNLWPIYEKKIEVTPLETFREGRISGTLLLDGAPASSLLVGLFHLPLSTETAEGTLAWSDFPDSAGRFQFTDLGAGRYYLGVMGAAGSLATIAPNPELILIGEDRPEADLPALRAVSAKRDEDGPAP